ncbi:hypothetical protein EGN72_18955 [Pseudorhodobacter sp. E13]|uniref:Hint domain-containing protein n=1 Tax=Pseudorhodobacter sp. E13 TaxID=2487931 RepID=UPI000FA8AB14|nr:Hint domain-containing protein [Pseudorhodobacter sp. E13]RUS58977.1 hypothetical protein EGN72_18955 [Pseudorhodobacter sp. E13]
MLRGGIAINEILVDPNGATSFDTDGNGTSAATDEFIELVNTTGAPISIAGLQFWDRGVGQWFTIPSGAVLGPGGHALIIIGVQPGGSLPTMPAGSLAFDAGRGSAVITNTGDNVVVYDPTANSYIVARFNGAALDNPTIGAAGYSGFSSTATRIGAGENFGNDVDGFSIQRAPDGSNVFVNNETPTPGTFNVCFTAGTRIETPSGPVMIEALRPGDLVLTRDHGAQPVVWVWSQSHTPAAFVQDQRLCPVRIARNALGNGLPSRDLLLSQQHRVLVASRIAERMFGASEVLVAAKNLTGLAGVDVVLPEQVVTYLHLLFGAHEIVFAEGAPSESLYLGPQALRAMDAPALSELALLLGVGTSTLPQSAHQPARLFAAGKLARKLVERHAKNHKALWAAPQFA